jgi:ketosteroid isomerase-like protein
MDRATYQAYLDAFMAQDFDGFSKFYADDVVFSLSGGKKIIHGRQGIVDFYRNVFERIREELTVTWFSGDAQAVAVEVDTVFEALADWPDFMSKPMAKGERFRITSWAHYTLRDGKFTSIRSLRAPATATDA